MRSLHLVLSLCALSATASATTTWSLRTSDTLPGCRAIDFNDLGGYFVLPPGDAPIRRSLDEGLTWVEAGNPPFDPGTPRYAIEAVHKSSTKGQLFVSIRAKAFGAIAVREYTVGTREPGLWEVRETKPDDESYTEVTIFDVRFRDSNVGFAAGSKRKGATGAPTPVLFATYDAGRTWSEQALSFAVEGEFLLLALPLDGTTLLVSTQKSGIFRSPDDGTSWERVFPAEGIQFLERDGDTVYAASFVQGPNGIFARAKADGTGWVSKSNLPEGNLEGFSAGNGLVRAALLSGGAGKLVSSGNRGDSWDTDTIPAGFSTAQLRCVQQGTNSAIAISKDPAQKEFLDGASAAPQERHGGGSPLEIGVFLGLIAIWTAVMAARRRLAFVRR